MAKGHTLCDKDIHVLQLEGMERIWVAELDENEIQEDEAVCGIAAELACGLYEVRIAPGGKANLSATEKSCVLVDEDLLGQINCTSGLVVATCLNFSLALAGQKIATVKSAPFAVSKADFERSVGMLRERGPLLQARPVQPSTIGVLYCDPATGEQARTMFEPILRQKLANVGARLHIAITVMEREEQVSRGIDYLLGSKVGVVLIASTTVPAGPEDAVGRAMGKAGCLIERYLAPVEPGHLLLLGYKDDVPVVSVPGCFRSLGRTVLDILLPPMMAGYRISAREVARMGHGGLLTK
jgi:molybdenum cofactor cytidylyltransferase